MSSKKKRNAPKRHTEPGHTPLHCASQRGHVEVVKALLGARAEPNRANKEGHTPLYYACSQGHVEVVKALLAAGADPNRSYENGYTALHWSSSQGLTEAVRALLGANADPNKSSAEGWTPLHFASAQGHADVARELMAHKASIVATDKNGFLPLHYATWAQHVDVVREVLKPREGEPLPSPDQPYLNGLTPLHYGSSIGNIDLVALLIAAGANPSRPDDEGISAVRYAGANAAILAQLHVDPSTLAHSPPTGGKSVPTLQPPSASHLLRPLLRPPVDESDPMAGAKTEKKAAPPPAPNPESMQLLEDLLVALDLSKYAARFRTEGIDLNEAARMTSDQLLRLGMPLGPRIKLLDAMQRYSVLFHSISCCFRPPPATESWPPLVSSTSLNGVHHLPVTECPSLTGSSSNNEGSNSASVSASASLSSSAEH